MSRKLALFSFVAIAAIALVAQADVPDPEGLWGLERTCPRSYPWSQCEMAGTGQGVPVYVVSTGINPNHFEFASETPRVVGFYPAGEPAYDIGGQGTHLAGIVGGTQTGVAPGTHFYSVRVTNAYGSSTISRVVDALETIYLYGEVGVVLMGVGLTRHSALLNTVLAYLKSDGFTIIVPAGNSDTNACNQSPANSPDVLTVGCSDRGDGICGRTNYGGCIDVFAPGEYISSAWGEDMGSYRTLTGTTPAAAHAAGVAAQYISSHSIEDPDTGYQAIVDHAFVGQLNIPDLSSPNLLVQQFAASQVIPLSHER